MQEGGEIVAMLRDGVNDAAALKQADATGPRLLDLRPLEPTDWALVLGLSLTPATIGQILRVKGSEDSQRGG